MDPWSGHSPPPPDPKKKSLIAQERDPFDRAVFQAVQSGWDADDLVILDEFGANTDGTRRYGRARRGKRVSETLPRNTPVNTTTIAVLTTRGMGPRWCLTGSLTRASFLAYLDQVLGPSLQPGQRVIMDNASPHRGPHVAQILAKWGCRVCYLPPYSPDFSPIEYAFAKVKAILRTQKARTRETLIPAIDHALHAITPTNARAFFAHCGYPLWPMLDQ